MRQKFLAHTDSRVVHHETQVGAALGLPSVFHREGDFSALLREFHCVADDIHEHLLKPYRVSHIVIIQHRVHDALVVHAFGLGLSITDAIDAVQEFLHRDLLGFHQHLAALDPIHIQNVIDKR